MVNKARLNVVLLTLLRNLVSSQTYWDTRWAQTIGPAVAGGEYSTIALGRTNLCTKLPPTRV
jgi:hypothetical protein